MNTSRWLTVLCLAASMPAYASSAFKPIELKDSEMAELRGRYVMPGRIISFGIVMSSTWTNAVGDTLTGKASMQVDSSTITPQFYVQTTGSTGNGTNPNTGTGNVTGGAGLGTGTGVTQSVRAAGDKNTAYNNVGINVTENGFAPSNAAQSGQVLVAGGTVTGDSAAGRVSVSANNGGLQMAIQANHNQGNSLQQIGGGQLLQGTVLTGNSNFVNNMTQLNVVMNNALNNPALNCNLDQLKGLRTLGY
ncbi:MULTISPECIES: hypothetical protein [Pseudomonas]|uniref:Fap system outer membrane protein n=1 Tax=Pseudomonas extremorientalis TaxID=169669 RepID=A0A1H0I7N4_9PSED|nr:MULTISPECIES: hypothetical protein [Pseudomonas]KAB0519948.1 hypothetical protein F7R08_09345 [Pseudomonas extremorientalis]OIN07514.1 hypothetical protein BFN10_16945 [Pseudomonas extremorientalis]QZP19096.1 hypothetical protein K5K89_17305 [Pseudomonas sp. DR208]UUN91244.1 hypothetical protein LUU92_12845 [Pseudomonas extremorientalis]WLG59353.1 hypothetical protein PSH77_12725 [Pseudomonas extremorientalis]